MAREEEIKYASKDYINYLLDKQEHHNENYTEYDIRQAFEKGAEWADEHPKNVCMMLEKNRGVMNYCLAKTPMDLASIGGAGKKIIGKHL